jgi:hypothetical protein
VSRRSWARRLGHQHAEVGGGEALAGCQFDAQLGVVDAIEAHQRGFQRGQVHQLLGLEAEAGGNIAVVGRVVALDAHLAQAAFDEADGDHARGHVLRRHHGLRGDDALALVQIVDARGELLQGRPGSVRGRGIPAPRLRVPRR